MSLDFFLFAEKQKILSRDGEHTISNQLNLEVNWKFIRRWMLVKREVRHNFRKMEVEYKTLFASVGAKYKKEGGHSVRVETKTTSTVVEAKGGSQDIASILSDVYAPTFKTEFKEWLQSIPQYPKAFKFQMNSVTELVNFRANDLFPDEVC